MVAYSLSPITVLLDSKPKETGGKFVWWFGGYGDSVCRQVLSSRLFAESSIYL